MASYLLLDIDDAVDTIMMIARTPPMTLTTMIILFIMIPFLANDFYVQHQYKISGSIN